MVAVFAAAAAAPVAGQPAAPSPCADTVAPTQPMAVSTGRPGVLRLHVFLAQGAPVTFYECRGERPRRLGTLAVPGDRTTLAPAAFWRCDRLARRFVATVTLPDGTFARGETDIRTRSCAHRYDLAVPPRARRGDAVRVSVQDRWAKGGTTGTLCIGPPGGRPDCDRFRLGRQIDVASRGFRPAGKGRWRIVARMPFARLSDTVAVGVRAVPEPDLPAILATGDSTMSGVESFLADGLLGRAEVIGDVRPGESLSRDPVPPWPRYARAQVAAHRPDVTVVSLGANEGFPIGAVECCGRPWVAAYGRRLRAAIRPYLRTGRVLLLTVPAPRDDRRYEAAAATNGAIVGLGGLPRVDVLRMDRRFSPEGYSDDIVYRGRRVDVREPDGVHLNVAGTSIAAREVIAVLRGYLRRSGRPGPAG